MPPHFGSLPAGRQILTVGQIPATMTVISPRAPAPREPAGMKRERGSAPRDAFLLTFGICGVRALPFFPRLAFALLNNLPVGQLALYATQKRVSARTIHVWALDEAARAARKEGDMKKSLRIVMVAAMAFLIVP